MFAEMSRPQETERAHLLLYLGQAGLAAPITSTHDEPLSRARHRSDRFYDGYLAIQWGRTKIQGCGPPFSVDNIVSKTNSKVRNKSKAIPDKQTKQTEVNITIKKTTTSECVGVY